MRRQMLGSNGRRGTVIAASAAVLCLGGVLAACGGGTADEGYVALGAAGTDSGRAPTGAVAPSGKVTLVPLDRGGGKGRGDGRGGSDGEGAGGRSGGRGPSPSASGSADGAGATGAASGGAPRPSGTPGTSGPGSGSGTGGASGGAGGPGEGSTGPTAPSVPGSPAPGGPAELTVGAPVRAAADERWCEKVTVEFRNTGGSAARSGIVTFATHVIGGLGIDWATIESTGPLPAPIDAGAARTKTYTVCVDAWRVPLGMHVETRDVTAVLK
ncbi:hypothetical protein ACIA74_25995 [Streptomyces sp. NPDC051658]|uniref:hypothetical protein n=1 Tax=Streptomyces sp. NPDC051658 TaxID=3365667 RepID=UPI0037AC396D